MLVPKPKHRFEFPSKGVFANRLLRASSIGTLLWWSIELIALAANADVGSPTLSADRSDLAAVPGIAAWVVVACATSIIDEILRACSVSPVQDLAHVRMVGLVIAYAWSASTLPKFDYTYRRHHKGLVGLGVQTASLAFVILNDAYEPRTAVIKNDAGVGQQVVTNVRALKM